MKSLLQKLFPFFFRVLSPADGLLLRGRTGALRAILSRSTAVVIPPPRLTAPVLKKRRMRRYRKVVGIR